MIAKNQRIRVGIYIDGSNLYYGGRKAGWQLDYAKLKAFIERKYEIVVINYYNSIGYEKDVEGKYIKDQQGKYVFNKATLKFEGHLKKIGIKIISKPLKFVNGNESIATNKLDGDIMIEALLDRDKWDELILMSGDSDFERLIKEIISLKKYVHIFSFESRISHELIKLATKNPFVIFTKLDSLKLLLKRKKQLTKQTE